MKLEIDLIRARLRAPFVSASGSIRDRDLLLVALEDGEGNVGYGEAAPLEPYDGVSIDDVRTALEDCRPVLADADPLTARSQCVEVTPLRQAIAAIDLALWDLAGRIRGEPVWSMLSTEQAAPVEVNYTIGAEDRAGAAREAGFARAAGFRCVKVKVGIGDDAGRLAAVRAAAGPGMAIRIDANGSWSVEEATAALRALEPVGLELCEEPVRGLDGIYNVARATSVPLAIDESASSSRDLFGITPICEAVCLKIARYGGIDGVLEAASRAMKVGYSVYLASTLDGPLGIAAAVHFAAASAISRPCGLATLSLFEGRKDPLAPDGGRIRVPRGPGLGDGLLDWYRKT